MIPTDHVLVSLITALVLCTCLASSALANDSSFGGAGGSLVPLENEHVAMRSEDITLEVVKSTAKGKEKGALEWKVDAVYTFENTSNERIKLQVGFPELACESDSPCDEDHPYSFHDLKTKVRGKTVEHTVGKLSKHAKDWREKLDRVHLFTVTFAPKETLTITHSYRHKLSNSVDGEHAHYVTRTGAMWAGPIGKARFTVKTPWPTYGVMWPEEFTLAERHEEPATTKLGDHLHTTWTHVFEMKDWTPKGDLNMIFLSDLFTGGLDCETPWLFKEKYDKALAARKRSHAKESSKARRAHVEAQLVEDCFADRSSKALRLLRNKPYAEHGYAFKSKDLREHYYKPAITTPCFRCFEPDIEEDDPVPHTYMSYAVNPRYSPELLSPAELLFVRLIKKAESQKKKKK